MNCRDQQNLVWKRCWKDRPNDSLQHVQHGQNRLEINSRSTFLTHTHARTHTHTHTHTQTHTHTAHVCVYYTVCVQCTHTVHVVIETKFLHRSHLIHQDTISLDPLPHTYRDTAVQVSMYIYTYSVKVCMQRFRVSCLGKPKCA